METTLLFQLQITYDGRFADICSHFNKSGIAKKVHYHASRALRCRDPFPTTRTPARAHTSSSPASRPPSLPSAIDRSGSSLAFDPPPPTPSFAYIRTLLYVYCHCCVWCLISLPLSPPGPARRRASVQHRSIDDLKDRYYQVWKKITERTGVRQIDLTYRYDAEHEARRKEQLHQLSKRCVVLQLPMQLTVYDSSMNYKRRPPWAPSGSSSSLPPPISLVYVLVHVG